MAPVRNTNRRGLGEVNGRPVNVARVLMFLAFLFFLIDTLLVGGVFTSSTLGWLLPAGLTSLALSFLV